MDRMGKPLKYLTTFQSADVAIITKLALADAVEFDEAAANKNIQSVDPGMEIMVSPKPEKELSNISTFLRVGASVLGKLRQRQNR